MTQRRLAATGRPKIAASVLEVVGGTPLVKLNRLPKSDGATVLAKMESLNPGGSVKDRIAVAMIEDAERRGVLKPGATVVEPTSGNTGIGLAMVCAVRGYRLILTMPDDMSVERQRLLARYGAENHLTPAIEGMSGSVFAGQALQREHPDYFMPQQFETPANPEAHRRATALEILEATEERIHVFVAGGGTGGTGTGGGGGVKEPVAGGGGGNGGEGHGGRGSAQGPCARRACDRCRAGALARALGRAGSTPRHSGHRRVLRARRLESRRARRDHPCARRGRHRDLAETGARGRAARGHLGGGKCLGGLSSCRGAPRRPGGGHGAVRYW